MGLEDKASSSSSGDVVAVVADGDLVEGTKDEASCGDITTAIITTSTPTNTDSVSVDESSLKHSGDQSVSANHTDSDKPVGSDGCIVPASKGEEEGGETSIAPDPLPSPPAADQNPSSPDETAPQSDTPENAEAFPCAAVSDGVEEPNHRLKQAGEHVSCKYTKEKLLERHWGVTIDQMRRVKALLRMGVCEEDLEIADRLIKLGRYVKLRYCIVLKHYGKRFLRSRVSFMFGVSRFDLNRGGEAKNLLKSVGQQIDGLFFCFSVLLCWMYSTPAAEYK